jgi:diadenosine tetraphosphatase ApaH/serine/threonine PP2A family protein phosphatase
MHIVFISDIHSNLAALEAVLGHLKTRSIDKYYCLGDIVGYAANPKECLDIIREIATETVFGNHEYAIIYPEHTKTFNSAAKAGIEYTRKNLSLDDIEWIRSLQPHMILPPFTIAHGSLRDFEEYVTDSTIARLSLEVQQTNLLFIGHTHYPEGYVYEVGARSARTMDLFVEGEVTLESGKKYLFNVGSVGQPRDGDPRACCCILDTDSLILELIRVEYDIKKAADAIDKAGLPELLGRRLYAGR